MNASAQDQLEQIVRRVVRPIFATGVRKQWIEEEMLAHVTAVYEEEFERLGDVQAALDRTRHRFGIADEVRLQLQASIPRFECYWIAFERSILMSRWLWLIAVFAVAVGPGIVLPALAQYRIDGSLMVVPLTLGGLITLAGVAGVCYGTVRGLGHLIK